MKRLTENKIVLVVRETRLEELKARFNTTSQARFYVEQLGGNFSDYENEDRAYHQAVEEVRQQLTLLGRVQTLHREFLPNFIFGPDDIAVAVGQDGLVANALKYLNGQPLIGVNPDPRRYDGQLLPFRVPDVSKIVPDVMAKKRRTKEVTMAKAALNNGQHLYAVNDLFIGPKSHGSARYTIKHGEDSEYHSSSGVIVSTGMGSTGWFSSLIAGARGISAAIDRSTETHAANDESGRAREPKKAPRRKAQLPWDADQLFFTVREPFPSNTTGTDLVFGRIEPASPLTLESHMPERGVIFSDGVEADFLEFNSGAKAEITVADRKGILVV